MKWILCLTLFVQYALAYKDADVLQCMKDNGLSDFVQMLEDSNVAVQLTGTGNCKTKVRNH